LRRVGCPSGCDWRSAGSDQAARLNVVGTLAFVPSEPFDPGGSRVYCGSRQSESLSVPPIGLTQFATVVFGGLTNWGGSRFVPAKLSNNKPE
jgi:hypothetical protein